MKKAQTTAIIIILLVVIAIILIVVAVKPSATGNVSKDTIKQEYPKISADNLQFLKTKWLNGKTNCGINSDYLEIQYLVSNTEADGFVCNVFDNGVSRVYEEDTFVYDNQHTTISGIHLTLRENHILKVCCKGKFFGITNDIYYTNEVCLPDINIASPC